jgi:FkbM family methyltransferase
MIVKGMSRADIEQLGKQHASNTEVANILNSFYLRVDLEETSIARHLTQDGFWESWVTRWFIENVTAGSICVDAGANYGYFTRLMAHLSGPQGIVYAIEANPVLTSHLDRSLVEFPDESASKVIVYNYALADVAKQVTLTVFGNNHCNSTIITTEEEQDLEINVCKIQALPLTHIVPQKLEIDILKLDIEGAEPLAYAGMQDMLDCVNVIVMEVNPEMIQKNPRFIHTLYVDRDVSYINWTGDEEPIEYQNLYALAQPVMLVLRKSKF